MRNITFIINLLAIVICSKSFGQATVTPNNWIAQTDYLGWDITPNGPDLNIKHELDQPIHFYTNAGAGTFNNRKMSIMRRTINGIERAGVAIHERGTNPITLPRSILHLGNNYFTSGVAGWRTWMDIGTFTGLQTDFAFFGIIPLDGDTTDNQQDHNDAAVVWGDNINPAAEGADNLRFIFSGPMNQTANDQSTQYSALEVGRFAPEGRLGIGNFTGNAFGGGSGIQPMRRLEIYDESLNEMFHPAPQLRLTFTPDGNVNAGVNTDFQCTHRGNLIINTRSDGAVRYTGIGNFNVLNVEPSRRLEVLDMGEQEPQLRLTYTPDANVNNGIWTDFQTTSSGDLFIHPWRNGNNQFVGINTSNPTNTLEINSNTPYVAGATGNSGLRFTNLRFGSLENSSYTGKVLSVDNNGNVILVRDIGGGSVNSTCTTQDIVARFDNTGNVIQCSDIYNNASATLNNRIGLFTTTPQYKFQVEGTALFTRNHITTPFGLTVHGQNNPPAVMIESKDDEGLSILHSATTSPNVKDQMKIYGDGNRQYHLRMVGTPTGNSTPNSITFDHEDNGGSVNSWMGYNTLSRITVMKDDFNSNPVPASPAGIVLGYAVYASKFFVEAQTPTYAGNYMVYGLTAGNTNSNSEKYHAGVFGYSSGSRIGQVSNKGAMFYATGASGSNTSSLGSNIGVEARAISTSTFTDSYGVYTTALGGQHTNYGIYSLVKGSGCANGSCTSAAGFFNGAVYTTQNTYFTSDSSLKQNITFIGHKDTLLNHIPVYSFNYDTLNNYGLNLETGTHYGVLAHEVKQVLPQMVRNFIQPAEYDSSGTIVSQQKNIQAVNYTEFIPLLIAGYKSQAKEIDTLTNQLTTLQSRLDSLVMAVASCCNAPLLNQNNSSNHQTIELDNTPAIILGNDPNPFAENTTINWNIPQQDTKTINAMLVFYNQNGSILKSVKIHQAGAGSLLVYGNNLSSGQYSYSLVVNNKVVKTKQMVKVK